jgi:hypothetical protein
MAFVPVNRLEESMVRAAADTSARALFYHHLMEAELFVIGEIGRAGEGEGPQTLLDADSLHIETISWQDRTFHPLFSSEERVRAFANHPVECFSMQGRALFECTRGASFLLNPGSELTKMLTPEEIDRWLAHADEAAPVNISVVEPKVYPKRLVKALCVLLMSRFQVVAAHLTYVSREGSGEPHPMIALIAEGDVQRLAQEIFKVAEIAMPGVIVDVIGLAPGARHDPFCEQITAVAPFYRRTHQPDSN